MAKFSLHPIEAWRMYMWTCGYKIPSSPSPTLSLSLSPFLSLSLSFSLSHTHSL